MKKTNMLIAVFAVLAAAAVAKAEDAISFDGENSFSLSAQLDAQARPASVAEAAIIPARVFAPEEISSLDKSLGSAITFVKARRLSPALLAGLECLRDSGTLEQKSAFVNGARGAVYTFPAACSADGRQTSINKDIIDDGLQWLCESYNDVIEYLSCHKGPDGEEVCDVELRTVLRTSCNWS